MEDHKSLFPFTDERTDWLLLLVGGELTRARKKFGPMASPHEGHSVIREELEELWEHIKADTGRSEKAQDEAIQLAAMALRYVYDLVEWGPLGTPGEAWRCAVNDADVRVHEFPSAALGTRCYCGAITWEGAPVDA